MLKLPLRIASFACTAAVFLGIVWMGTRAQSQSDLQEELNVVYGEVAGQKLSMDIFRPSNTDGTNGLPVVLFVHGGGWAAGNRKDFHELAKGMARRGYFAASVGYRLVNGTTNNIYPAQLDDVQRAVRWVRSHAADYHLDPKKVGALGASAGGHLVTLLGTVETRDKKEDALSKYSSKVQCVVDIFGPTDLTPDFTKNGDSGPMVQNLVNNLIGLPREASLEPYKAASPLFYVSTNTAPFLIFHGTVDPLVPLDQSERFDAALKKLGVESKLVIFQGEGHGFGKKENIDTFIKEAVAFFDRHLKK